MSGFSALTLAPTLHYRTLGPGDLQQYRDHLGRLDEDAKRLRFGGAVSDGFIADHAKSSLNGRGIVEGCFAGDQLCASSELQPLAASPRQAAEAAFAVERPFRGKGIGTELMRRAILRAQERGIKTIYTICVAENLRMRRLAEKYNAELHIEHNEVEATLRMPPPPASLFTGWNGMAGGSAVRAR